MYIHVFGNSPSPAFATYGLRRTARNAEFSFGDDVCSFVERNFYVDDGLVSLPSVEEAVSFDEKNTASVVSGGRIPST